MPTHRPPFDLPRWTPDDARQVIDALERSGQPVSLFAAEHDIDAQRLYVWRRRLGARAERTTFEELSVRPRATALVLHGRDASFEVQLSSGVVVSVPPSFDPVALARLLEVLARAAGC